MGTKKEFDELEIFFKEIPTATLRNRQAVHSIDADISSALEKFSIEEKSKMSSPLTNFPNLYSSSQSVNFFNGFDLKHQSKGNLDGSSNGYRTNLLNGERDEPKLPDEKSLSLAFEELSFNTNPSFVKQLGNSLTNSHPLVRTDALQISPQLDQSMNGVLNHNQSNVNFPNSGAMPINHGMHPYQLPPNLPVPGIEFTASPHQQRFFLDSPHQHLLGQPNMAVQNLEEERHYKLYQQYLYQQQLRNQRPEVLRYRKNMNLANNPLSERQMQPNPFESCNFPHRHQVLDKFGKQYYPEKIPTRSHGMNSLRPLKFNMSNGSLKLDSLDLNYASRPIQLKYNSLDEVTGKLYFLAKDQHGCRFLQRKFAEGNLEDLNKIFCEIIDHIVELMTDPFGNYLVQKMLEVCNENQRMRIIHAITREAGMLIRISCNMHGTRVVQKVIETLQTEEQIYTVVSSLRPGIVSLINDINGNHVAQRCLQYLAPQQCEFLFDAAISHCVEIATDRQGCCVLQKCVYHSFGDQRDQLMSEISLHSLVLSQDPFGNYVVQYVLDQKVPWVITAVLDQLEGSYQSLSMQKHSSNVVEKCLKFAKDEERVQIVRELMNSPHFLQILQDAFGNYVIQSALKQCKGALNSALVEAIKPHVPALRSHPYGKKILSCTSLKKQ